VSETIRSFIAVDISPEAREKLAAAQDRLRPVAGGVKWVDSGSFHLTLKFLGAVEQGRLGETWKSVSKTLVGAKGFVMRFRGIGAFPTATRVRVIWAGVEAGQEELADLAERVERACAEHGFERENRPFQAHLTLGRVREPVVNTRLAEMIQELSREELGEVAVDRVRLMKSELTPKGAKYAELGHETLK
jgi:2'-5' RNA ligase